MFNESKKSVKSIAVFVATVFAVSVFGIAGTVYAADDSGYATKSIHETGEGHTYKKPHQKSYTGPFDYAPRTYTAPAPRPMAPTGNKCNTFTFDATKSYDPDNQKISVLWDFGDGQTSDLPVVTHSYEKPGDYNVTLTVKDNSGQVCDTDVTTTKVSPNTPPVAVVGPEAMACVGETVSFDASQTQFSPGSSPKVSWDFGDGTTGEGLKVSHAYEKAGNYVVRAIVDDGKGTACSVSGASTVAKIGSRPTLDLTGPGSLCIGRAAAFNAQATGASKIHWDFGDGSTMDGGSSVTHAYTKPGSYTVTATADNGGGFSCSTAVDTEKVNVFGSPIADAGENLACCVGKVVQFDGSKSQSADGSALNYHWDFGDGATADTATASHAYEKTGNYRVVLTVKDNSGSDCGTAVDSFVAVVNAKPTAIAEVR